MTQYQFHWRPPGGSTASTSAVTLQADSQLHGAALALRHFGQLGCDLAAPFGHLDITDATGVRHMLLVEEVLDWLKEPKQAAFLDREALAALLH